ncbi:uncharacterized protein [Miscanthus floridulus]|uniref:uncharacterized protein n=1 Tax=Miscanthus floridulus TaxID=154761 RepID=UPI003457EEAD
MKQAGEEAPTPHEAEALKPGEVEAPSIAEATEGEVKAARTSKAEVADAGAPRTTEAEVAEAGALETTEAKATEASLGVAEPAAQDAKTEAGQALELEEELTRVAGERDTFRSQADQAVASAKAITRQLGVEQGAHLLMKGALAEALKVAKASQVEALAWKEKAEGLEKEVTRAAEASVVVSAVLEAEIWEHNMLQSAAHTTWALHTGVKHALAIVSSHYTSIDLEAVSDGYIVVEDDEKAEEEVMKLVEAEGPGTALAKLFEEEVVPPTPSTDAGDPKF